MIPLIAPRQTGRQAARIAGSTFGALQSETRPAGTAATPARLCRQLSDGYRVGTRITLIRIRISFVSFGTNLCAVRHTLAARATKEEANATCRISGRAYTDGRAGNGGE